MNIVTKLFKLPDGRSSYVCDMPHGFFEDTQRAVNEKIHTIMVDKFADEIYKEIRADVYKNVDKSLIAKEVGRKIEEKVIQALEKMK